MPVTIDGSNTPTAGGVVYGDGTEYASTAAGTSGQVLTSAGAGAPTWASISSGFTLGTPIATTSGNSVDFTNIPNGVKQITISFSGVGTDTSSILVQIGDSGGIQTTGYVSVSVRVANNVSTVSTTSSDGFVINMVVTSNLFYGTMTLMLENNTTNTWVSTHSGRASTSSANVGGGNKSLSQRLDRLRITTVGGDAFDGGEVNIAFL
jgi:hypothetical protein